MREVFDMEGYNVTLRLLFFFPEISTWLPDTMMSK